MIVMAKQDVKDYIFPIFAENHFPLHREGEGQAGKGFRLRVRLSKSIFLHQKQCFLASLYSCKFTLGISLFQQQRETSERRDGGEAAGVVGAV